MTENNDIQRLRELSAGTYLHNKDTGVLRLEDVPTGGPLFTDVELENQGEDEMFTKVQFSTDEFDLDDFVVIMVEERDDDESYDIRVTFESSGVTHEFLFTQFNDEAWAEEMIQQGESYSVAANDVPNFVAQVVEDKFGLDVVNG